MSTRLSTHNMLCFMLFLISAQSMGKKQACFMGKYPLVFP